MIAIILGTRPEIIKLSPVIRCLEKRQIPYYVLHTGQHYSYELDNSFFEILEIPKPKYNLTVGSNSQAIQTAEIMKGIESVLLMDYPKFVIVLGDTNSVLAGAIVCSKFNDVKLCHVEAGLRSFDRTMPEEINRILTDHVSDYLFAPTERSKEILFEEGINVGKIFVTGNTIVDAVKENIGIAQKKSKILEKYKCEPQSFFLMTIHRQENVEDVMRLKTIVDAVIKIANEHDVKIMFPVHPRTKKALTNANIKFSSKITLLDPLNYFDFLLLMQSSRLILSDSGGVQEESCILGTPCVTLRQNTERPETLEVGSNILGGITYDTIRKSVNEMLNRDSNWNNPFGDGKSGERIISKLINC